MKSTWDHQGALIIFHTHVLFMKSTGVDLSEKHMGMEDPCTLHEEHMGSSS